MKKNLDSTSIFTGITPKQDNNSKIKSSTPSTISDETLKSSLTVIAELLNEIEKNKKAKQDRAIYLEQKI
jgi:hypothetical protein